jgi:hypothetical protein
MEQVEKQRGGSVTKNTLDSNLMIMLKGVATTLLDMKIFYPRGILVMNLCMGNKKKSNKGYGDGNLYASFQRKSW